MIKLYKHLPHKLKRRVVKKKGGYAYNDFLEFHRVSIELARAGYREIGLEWRKTARERNLKFQYSRHIGGAFIWADSIKGVDYWYNADGIVQEYRDEEIRLMELLK